MPIARLALAVLLAGTFCAAQPKEAPPFRGDYPAYWQEVCARCHGANGNGRDNAGTPLPDAGFDFTDSRKAGRKKDADWVKVTLQGKDKMPAFKTRMTEEQALRMVKDMLRPFGARN